MSVTENCNELCERRSVCTTCHRYKAPHGRSVAAEAANGYCTDDCIGYQDEPTAGHLWAGEYYEALRNRLDT